MKLNYFQIFSPEDAPRLIDLVTVNDENVKPAFYSVLRETLFADNIEAATRISGTGRDRWRVVTAKGELVEISGTMSGGGRKEIRFVFTIMSHLTKHFLEVAWANAFVLTQVRL
jgi:chromosome segregation ATPase